MTLRLEGSVQALQAQIPVWCGLLEPESDTHSLLRVGADSPEALLAQVLMIGRDAEWVEGHDLRPAMQDVLGRMTKLFAVRQ